jgi:hypothetical protein
VARGVALVGEVVEAFVLCANSGTHETHGVVGWINRVALRVFSSAKMGSKMGLGDFLEAEVDVWDWKTGPVAEPVRHAFFQVCGVRVAVSCDFGGELAVVVDEVRAGC